MSLAILRIEDLRKPWLPAALLFCLLGATPFLAFAQAAGAEPPPIGLLGWILWGAGFAVVWLALYHGLYPLLLRHFRPEYAESLFWPLIAIFTLTWFHLSSLLVLGGRLYLWGGWVTACIAGGLAWIWLVLVLLRRA
jgi:hypothetical protein